MNASQKDELLQARMARAGITLSREDVRTLRRAEITLHRWHELECGDGNGYITRDEVTGKPFYTNCNFRGIAANDPRATRAIADREKGAEDRINAVCRRNGLHCYVQTDPRGCALYVALEPMADWNYSSRGLPVCL